MYSVYEEFRNVHFLYSAIGGGNRPLQNVNLYICICVLSQFYQQEPTKIYFSFFHARFINKIFPMYVFL